MYRIILSPLAKNQLKLLKQGHKEAIGLLIEDLKEYPLLGKPLRRDLAGKFSYRIGVYRVIYKVSSTDKIVFILSAGHRSVIYG